MDKVKSFASIEGKVIISLTEEEARALDAIVGYGADRFVKWFYENHGKHYLKPHEEAMRSLFDNVRKELSPHLHKFDEARAVFDGRKKATWNEIKPNILKTA